MTARDYINEVKLGLLKISVNVLFDDMTILTMVNKARKQIQMATLNMFSEFYYDEIQYSLFSITPLNFTYNPNNQEFAILMPDSFIEPVDVWIYHQNPDPTSGVFILNQMRLVDPREYIYTVQNTFNTPQETTLVGYFENNVADGRTRLFFSMPLQYFNSIIGLNPVLRIYFLALVDDLEHIVNVGFGGIQARETPDVEQQIPPQCHELVVQQAIVNLLGSTDLVSALQRAKDELQISFAMLDLEKDFERLQKSFFLPSKESFEGDDIAKSQFIQEKS